MDVFQGFVVFVSGFLWFDGFFAKVLVLLFCGFMVLLRCCSVLLHDFLVLQWFCSDLFSWLCGFTRFDIVVCLLLVRFCSGFMIVLACGLAGLWRCYSSFNIGLCGLTLFS